VPAQLISIIPKLTIFLNFKNFAERIISTLKKLKSWSKGSTKFIPNYSISNLNEVADCIELLSWAAREKSDLDFKRISDERLVAGERNGFGSDKPGD